MFVSGIFYLIFLDHSWALIIETTKNKTLDGKNYCIKYVESSNRVY